MTLTNRLEVVVLIIMLFQVSSLRTVAAILVTMTSRTVELSTNETTPYKVNHEQNTTQTGYCKC